MKRTMSKTSKRRIYHKRGNCSECLWGPHYKSIGKPDNWCCWHERKIENPQDERCNQFYRGDFARNKKD